MDYRIFDRFEKIIKNRTDESPILQICRNYEKFDKYGHGHVTGYKLLIGSSHFAVIDIDLSHDLIDKYDSESIDYIRSDIEEGLMEIFKNLNVIIVSSCSGSFHIWCDGSNIREMSKSTDQDRPKKVAFIKAFTYKDDVIINGDHLNINTFDVDIFLPIITEKQVGIMLPGSIATNKFDELGRYEVIKWNDESKKISSLEDVWEVMQSTYSFGDLETIWKSPEPIPIETKKVEPKIIKVDYEESDVSMTKELFNLIQHGFVNLEIHNDAESIEKNLTLYTLITALNACINFDISYQDTLNFLDFVEQNCNLTENAKLHFADKIFRLRDIKANHPFGLVKMLKTYNNKYYMSKIAPYLSDKSNHISMESDFSLKNIKYKKYVDGDGKFKIEELISDIKKILVLFVDDEACFIKVRRGGRNELEKQTRRELKSLLSFTYIDGFYWNGKTRTSLSDIVFDAYEREFCKDGYKFHTNDKNLFSIFQGFIYPKSNDVDMKTIQLFIDHIFNIISSKNKEIYEYIISWIAFCIQKPGEKTCVCPILIGKKGCGKSIFSSTIANIFGDFAIPSLSKIVSIAGQFNSILENRMFIILNEMNLKYSGDLLNVLKELVTDPIITINKKGVSEYKAENVTNFMMTTNHKNPIPITSDNRRFFIINISDDEIGNIDYFNKLRDQIKSESFYPNLYNFFRLIDISNFNPVLYPKTDELYEIIEENLDTFDSYMKCRYISYIEGVIYDESFDDYKDFALQRFGKCMNFNEFIRRIKEVCESKRRMVNGNRKTYLVLKSTSLKNYQDDNIELLNNDEIDDINHI